MKKYHNNPCENKPVNDCFPCGNDYECAPCDNGVFHGDSYMTALQCLNEKVDTSMRTYRQVMDENYKTLRTLQRCGEEVGAFYHNGEVSIQEGYNGDEGCTYYIIRKNVVDRCNKPIRIELYPAYKNLTNSKLEQSIFNACKNNNANVIIPAINIGENGWFGHAIYNCAPIHTSEADNLFTVGFTKSGVMRIYPNTTSIETILADGIENAMGCYGALVVNGEFAEGTYIENIPNADIQTARILMGQNATTREVFFAYAPKNDAFPGMTSKTLAEILKNFGCTLVVELISGENTCAMYQGSMVSYPTNYDVPALYAYWVITREKYYCNDYTRELAKLSIIEGYNSYANFTTDRNLNKEIAERTEADATITANLNNEINERKEADEAETEARKAADTQLQNNIDAETEARVTADNQEKEAREAADTQLQNNIDAEAQARIEADEAEAQERADEDATLQAEIEQEISDRKTEDTRILTESKTYTDTRVDTVNNALTEEISNRVEADSTITNLISQEVNARTQADADLSARFDNVHSIPAGGSAGQVLSKVDGTNYNVQWVDPSGGGVDTSNIKKDGSTETTGVIPFALGIKTDSIESNTGVTIQTAGMRYEGEGLDGNPFYRNIQFGNEAPVTLEYGSIYIQIEEE